MFIGWFENRGVFGSPFFISITSLSFFNAMDKTTLNETSLLEQIKDCNGKLELYQTVLKDKIGEKKRMFFELQIKHTQKKISDFNHLYNLLKP